MIVLLVVRRRGLRVRTVPAAVGHHCPYLCITSHRSTAPAYRHWCDHPPSSTPRSIPIFTISSSSSNSSLPIRCSAPILHPAVTWTSQPSAWKRSEPGPARPELRRVWSISAVPDLGSSTTTDRRRLPVTSEVNSTRSAAVAAAVDVRLWSAVQEWTGHIVTASVVWGSRFRRLLLLALRWLRSATVSKHGFKWGITYSKIQRYVLRKWQNVWQLSDMATSKLTFDAHISAVCKNAHFHLRALRHIRSSLTTDMATSTGKFYREIEPSVSLGIKYENTTRRKETVITRLRFGVCRTNEYLHKIKVLSTDRCHECKTDVETVRHLLLDCPVSPLCGKVLDIMHVFKYEPWFKGYITKSQNSRCDLHFTVI